MGNKLRIGMIASNVFRIPPTPPETYLPQGSSGATETVVHLITEELVRRGHEVTLFASGDSATSARLVSVTPTATNFVVTDKRQREQYEHVLIAKAYAMAKDGQFDIIHSHFDTRTAFYAPLVDTPTISTLHSPLEGLLKDLLVHFKDTQYYASISNHQRNAIPDLRYAVTAYNGIEIERIPFYAQKEKEDYLIFAGRIDDTKGVAEAIAVAKQTNLRLHIFGAAKAGSGYWTQKIKPLIDGKQIIYKGTVPRAELFEHLGKAQAFIFPLKWDEPFGLVTIEAMAVGTPTIASRRGALPEIIENGKSGFLCDTIEQMVAAVHNIKSINPAHCRQRVEDMFTVAKVVDRYEQAYRAILDKRS